MKNHQAVRLGEVLRRVARFEPRDDSAEYHFAGTYSFARGIFAGERKPGSAFNLPKVQRVHEGDFVYCKIMAWEGAFGLVPREAHGCVMSGAFVAYEVNQELIDPDYLAYYFKISSVWKTIGSQSTGTNVRRRSLHPKQFEEATIPLPPLEEQRRIVARIENLAKKIDEARDIRGQIKSEADALSKVMSQVSFGSVNTTVGDVAEVTKLAGFEYTEHFTHAQPGNVVVVRAGNVRNSGLSLSNVMTISEEVSNALPRSQLKPGDVLMTFIGAKIGDVTYVREGHPRLHCGPNVSKITPKQEVSHLYLVKVLQSLLVQDQIKEITKVAAQPSLSMKTIRQLKIPVPTLAEQKRVVSYLDSLQARWDILRRLQDEATAELDALMPAILDKAFKGEL